MMRFFFGLILVSTLLVGCGRSGSEAPAAASSLTVTVAKPITRSIKREVAASGSVAAWQEMILGVEVTGFRVARVLVEPGDRVVAGQALVELDRRTLEVQARQAEASLRQARASAELAASQAKRGETLLAQNLISTSNFDELQANRARAEAQVVVSEGLRDEAALRLGFATLRAPDAGIIAVRKVQPGQVVSAGNELLRLIRRGRLEWRAEIAERDIGRLQVGATVMLRAPGGENVTGVVRAVSPGVDPQTRTGTLFADLPSPGPLRAGMFVEGRLQVGTAEVLAVPGPRPSVVFRDGYAYVFVLGDGGRVVQRRVDTGGTQGDFIELRSGVTPAETIVVRGAGFLSDGDIVKVVEQKTQERSAS
ncbi:MAG: efflux RND transporter periplasmic adaptor subunit [Steroidobacteraceae bacterium]